MELTNQVPEKLIGPPEARATVLAMHPSVQSVIAFMQQSMPADELIHVANAVAGLAPVIWGRHKQVEELHAITVSEPSIA